MRVQLAVALTFVAALLIGVDLSYSQRVSEYKTETFSIKEYVNAPKELSGEADNEISKYGLPFKFTYDGVEYSEGQELAISSNGWMMFGTDNASPKINWDIVGDKEVPRAISIFSHDMVVGGIYIGVEGESPDRVFSVEFRDMRFIESEKPSVHAQIKLYEGSNNIEFIYSENGLEMFPKEIFGVGLNGAESKKEEFSFLRYENAFAITPKENVRFLPSGGGSGVDAVPMLTIAPTSHDFGSLLVYKELTTCFTLTNTGTPAEGNGKDIRLMISSLSFSPSAPDYSIISSTIPEGGLGVGESAEICIRFSPMGSGQRSSALMITSNDAETPTKGFGLSGNGLAPLVSVNTVDLFKNKIADVDDSLTQSFWITNTGSYALNVHDIVINGEYRDQYEIMNMPTESIAPGESVEVHVLYIARYEGRLPSELIVMTDAFVNPNRMVRLWAQGVIPRMSVNVRSIDFDSVSIGETVTQTITISNPGSDTLTVRRNSFVSADPDFFYQGLNGDTLIAPGTSRTVIVGFAPRARGTRLARALFHGNMQPTFTEPSIDTSELYIDIRGVGVPSGALYVDGIATIDSATIGEQVCHTITLENTGLGELTINSVTLAGSTEFAVSGATFPLTLAAKSTKALTFCATPSAAGLRSGDLIVSAVSGDNVITQTLPVGVFGIDRCVSTNVTTAFDEIVRLGKTATQTITITNCGNVTALFSASISNGSAFYTMLSSVTDVTLAPAATHTFTVEFTPTARGNQHGTLTVSSEGITPSVIALNGVGGVTTLSHATINVPPTAVGSNNSFDVVVTNSGNVDWTPGTLSITPSAEYTMESEPASIAPNGGTGTFRFSFAPTSDGTHNAAVTFPVGDQTSSFSFNFNGAVSSVKHSASQGYVLSQNYPNPFNPSTNVTFTTPKTGMVKIVVVDMTGNEVGVVTDQVYGMGTHQVNFDASQLSSGVYVYQLVADGVRLERTMILNK